MHICQPPPPHSFCIWICSRNSVRVPVFILTYRMIAVLQPQAIMRKQCPDISNYACGFAAVGEGEQSALFKLPEQAPCLCVVEGRSEGSTARLPNNFHPLLPLLH